MHPQIFHFLLDLKENNHKPWFDENRDTYLAIRESLIQIMAEIIPKVAVFDAEIERCEAKKTLFRINRDVRFSKNKAPYKTNFAAEISPADKKGMEFPGYYFHFEPESCFIAGGLYMPENTSLAKIRNYIDYNPKALHQVIEAADFKKYLGQLQGERLKSAPKGYAKDHPEIYFLAMKGFFVSCNFPMEKIFEPDFAEYCAQVCKVIYPLNLFLREAISKE